MLEKNTQQNIPHPPTDSNCKDFEDVVGDSIRKEILENGFNLHYVKEEEKLREEFILKFTVWNDKYKYATLNGKEEYPTPNDIADFWLKKIAEREAESREKLIKKIKAIKTREPNGTFIHIEVYKDKILENI